MLLKSENEAVASYGSCHCIAERISLKCFDVCVYMRVCVCASTMLLARRIKAVLSEFRCLDFLFSLAQSVAQGSEKCSLTHPTRNSPPP